MSSTYNDMYLESGNGDYEVPYITYDEELFMVSDKSNVTDYNNLIFKIYDLISNNNGYLNFNDINLEDQNILCSLYIEYKELDLVEMLINTHLDNEIIREIKKEFKCGKSDLKIWIKTAIKSSIKDDIQNIINNVIDSFV